MPRSMTDRTRRTIVEAAVAAWASDPSTSLGEIARSAGVGRTTVHRYFADRALLVAAVDDACRDQFEQAGRRARVSTGPAIEALHRLCREYLELGDHLALVVADQPIVDTDGWSDVDGELIALVARGHQDGSIAPSLDASWVITAMWVLIYAARLVMESGQASRREAADMLEKTLGSGLRPG